LDLQPLDEGPRRKEWQIEDKPIWYHIEGKSLGSDPKKRAQNESSLFEDPRCKLGSKVSSNSRVQFASNESKLVPRNLDPGPAQSKVGLNAM